MNKYIYLCIDSDRIGLGTAVKTTNKCFVETASQITYDLVNIDGRKKILIWVS